jgi:hypothetical protein
MRNRSPTSAEKHGYKSGYTGRARQTRKGRFTVCDVESAWRIIASISGHEYEALFAIALTTNMRPCAYASVAFTLEVYSHILPHMQEAAALNVEALLMSA